MIRRIPKAMLAQSPIIAFVPTTDAARARGFYEGVLGLRLVSDDPFSLVFDANGTMLRVVKLQTFTPAPFTILGWNVPDIDDAVTRLTERGVAFEHCGMKDQDPRGIWTSPSGARVAWFKDPDGNVLSVSQLAPSAD
jgi:catechol 2,3-dioxygenase-like lactoylglutathione lyase family enzyme